MRLKINQPNEISRAVMPEDYWDDGTLDHDKFDDYIKRRDSANEHMQKAFRFIFIDYATKDEEWYRLYNIYQALRYAIHCAENPNSKGVDSYPPIRITDEPIPECKWRQE